MAPFAVAQTVTLAPEAVAPLAGAVRVTVGAGVLVTVTVNAAALVFRRVSTALQLTVVVPIGNVVPLAGTHATVTLPSTASIALAVNVTIAPAPLVACTFWFGGTVMTGGVVSRTVTVNNPDAAFPIASVAVALNVTIAPDALVASAVGFGGSVSVGAVVSRTVTVKLFVPALA